MNFADFIAHVDRLKEEADLLGIPYEELPMVGTLGRAATYWEVEKPTIQKAWPEVAETMKLKPNQFFVLVDID